MLQEVTTDDTDIVSVLRNALADKVGQDRFALWFGAADCVAIEQGAIVVSASNQFALDRLRKDFRDDLRVVSSQVLGRELNIEFRVDAEQDAIGQAGADQPSCRPQSPPSESKSAGQSVEQKKLSRRYASLDSFVVGDLNRVAFTAAASTSGRLGAVTPLFVYGPTGSGKTHLLQGILTAVRKTQPRRRSILLSAEQFTTYFLEALRGTGLPSFRSRYRNADLLLIDDVQFFAGKRATLVELQHTIDSLLREGRQVVLAADRSPIELSGVGPELVTRMSGGLVCAIERPEKATRRGIADQFARQRQYDMPPDVLDLIATEISGDARQISGALNRLHATSKALDAPITVEFAQNALSDIFRSIRPMVRITDVEQAVCEVFGLDPKQLHSPRRSRTIAEPRMLAMWLARKYTRAAFSEIGEHFGRRSHSTVISAQKKVGAWMTAGKAVQIGHGDCTVDDAIRRIETRLRVG